jgi:hypothetical protein
MAIKVTTFKPIYENNTSTPQATVLSAANNVIVVSGMNNNGILKFEISVDGGTTWVADDSLNFEGNGTITLEKVNAIIRADVTGVNNAGNVKALLGF